MDVSSEDRKIEPWPPAKATEMIRKYARDEFLVLSYKIHATERMIERDLITSDIIHVLKNGFVYSKAVPAINKMLFRYVIEGTSPNSHGRVLRVVLIPSPSRATIKVVTVMWADERTLAL